MFKKTLLVSLFLFGPFSGAMTDKTFADGGGELAKADTYYKNGNYQQAETNYRNIVTNYPHTDYALKARAGLAKVNLAVGNNTDANTAIEKLKNNFSSHSGLPKAIDEIAHISSNCKHKCILVAVNVRRGVAAVVHYKHISIT